MCVEDRMDVGLYHSNIKQKYGNALVIVDPQLDFHEGEKVSPCDV